MTDAIDAAPIGAPIGDDSLLAGLAARCGEARLVRSTDPGETAPDIDDVAARAWCAPANLDEAASVLAWAAEAHVAIVPVGAGTRLGLGNRPRAVDLLLSTHRLNQVIEYEPADLTITVQAGTRLADIQRVLAERGQFLPIDPPFASRATIGGLVAINASGPWRLRYGSLRDLVIGTRAVNTDGQISKSGGKVVKNVTGYDLNKLYIGSLGTLGLIGELTFKVQPAPRETRTIVATFAELAGVTKAADRLVRSPLTPSAVSILAPSAATALGQSIGHAPGRGYVQVGLAAGFEKQLARQLTGITGMATDAGASRVGEIDLAAAEMLWNAIREFPATPASAGIAACVRINVPINQVAALIDGTEQSPSCNASVLAHTGSGSVHAWLTADSDLALLTALRRLRAIAREREGTLVIESCPSQLKSQIDVWGEAGDAIGIMRRIKAKLDPTGILNPGRFIGGI